VICLTGGPSRSRSLPVDEPALLIRTVTSPVAWGGGRDGGGVGDVERDRLGARQVDLAGIAAPA
jgi:hypothetical protein